jgi:hypothetical protein
MDSALAFLFLFQVPFAHILAADAISVPVSSGTPINLRFDETVSSRTHQVGELVRVVVQNDVMIQGRTVIKGGTVARARVVDVKKKGVFGSEGRVSVAVESVPGVDGTAIPISATSRAQGENQLALALVLGLLLCLPVLFITGTSGTIEAGSVATGNVATTTTVSVPVAG